MRYCSQNHARSTTRPGGFTLAELIVVMGIIAVLVTVLVVVVSGARESARVATTSVTMTSMNQAMVRFREDVGYLPPVLDESRSLMESPDLDDPNIFSRLQGWYSYTSPAEYLLGYGHHGEDGFGWEPSNDYASQYGPTAGSLVDESFRLGIRDPGFDGVWTSTRSKENKGTLQGRLERFESGSAKDEGNVMGPYLELPSTSLIGSLGWKVLDPDAIGEWDTTSIDPGSGQPRVFFPGEAGYDDLAPKVICDAWGSPIRYYRLNYPTGNPGGGYPSNYQVEINGSTRPYSPAMSQYIALRPWELEAGAATDYRVPMGASDWGDFNSTLDSEALSSKGDSTTSYELQAGEFAFLSAGPDRRINNWMRNDFIDIGGNDGQTFTDEWHYSWGSLPGSSPTYQVPATEEVNEDNIVEVGS